MMQWAIVAALLFAAARADPATTVWRLDGLDAIGGAHVEGRPHLIATPAGKAVAFDGISDALFVDTHPLAGAPAFTIEAVFRPDGGAFEQRWLHLAETDPATGNDTGTRFLFEIRVVGKRWYLDAFTTGAGYKRTLVVPDKTFAVGRWYRVAMTCDGKLFRSYVDGVEQAEAAIAFTPQGTGHASIGTRINRASYFHGAIYEIRFTPRALEPKDFAPLPAGLGD